MVGAVGVLIWVIWLTGIMLGDSRRVTMLALSGVSLLGSGLVVELRRRCTAEEAATENERRYRFLADHSFDMIVQFDPETQICTYVSPACQRLYGYEAHEMLALRTEQLIHPDDLSIIEDALHRLETRTDHPPIVYRAQRKDGIYIWVEASLTRSTLSETGESEIVSVVREVSRRVLYEDALRQAKDEADSANRSKSQFLATMSHELRTPLNAIIGFAEIMKHEVMGPIASEQYRSYIDDIHMSGTHLLQLINDILDLSKAEAGKLEVNEGVIDVADTIRSVVRLTAASIETGELNVDVDVPPDLPLLRADERKTRQVLFNLVGNAVKFTPAGGHIKVGASYDPKIGTRIIVSDSGIGIADKDLPRVFEAFVQLDSSLGRQHGGTGLGLPTARALVELHGGTLDLASSEGHGTTATVTFPPERTLQGDPAAIARSAAELRIRDRGRPARLPASGRQSV